MQGRTLYVSMLIHALEQMSPTEDASSIIGSLLVPPGSITVEQAIEQCNQSQGRARFIVTGFKDGKLHIDRIDEFQTRMDR